MGKPAARIGDYHTCPKTTSKVPHVGGPVVAGSSNVFIGGMPAARKGDRVVCVGPPDTIKEGSATVFINGKPAARMGDATAHGGKIVIGCGTVLIGDNANFTPSQSSTSSSQSSSRAEQNNNDNTNSARANSHSSTAPREQASSVVIENEPRWLKVRANYDDRWQTPLPAENIEVEVDGETHQDSLSLEKGKQKNTYSLDKAAAEYSLANKEAGIAVLTDLAPQANQVHVDIKGVRNIEQQIASCTETIQSDLDGIYHEVVDSMGGFQKEWEAHGIATLDDGLLDGAKTWGKDLIGLFSIETWQKAGDTISSFSSVAFDYTYNYVEDKYEAITDTIVDEHGNIKNVTWITARLYDEVEQSIINKTSEVNQLLKDAESLFEDVANIGCKAKVMAENHDRILALPQMIANSDIDEVVAKIDAEWASEIKESENYPLVLALIQEHNTALIFSAYVGLILEAIPPNFYAYYGGKYGVYILLELILTIVLGFLTLGYGVAARAAMWTAKLAQFANVAKRVQNITKAAEALNAFKLMIRTIAKVTHNMEQVASLLVKRPLGRYPTSSNKTLNITKNNIRRNKKCRICKGDHKTPASLLGEIEYK